MIIECVLALILLCERLALNSYNQNILSYVPCFNRLLQITLRNFTKNFSLAFDMFDLFSKNRYCHWDNKPVGN